jgi:hypothetical protein
VRAACLFDHAAKTGGGGEGVRQFAGEQGVKCVERHEGFLSDSIPEMVVFSLIYDIVGE